MSDKKHFKIIPHLKITGSELMKGCVIKDNNVCTVTDNTSCIFTDICDYDDGSLCIIDVCGDDHT